MSPVTRGFFGRRRIPPELADRVPPGQYVETGFPVLTAGPTPRVAEEEYALTLDGLVGSSRTWTLPDLRALPPSTFDGDIHCVTTWSKLGTSFGGVSVDTLLEQVQPRPEATHVVVSSYGGYTTNLPLEDVTGGKAWVVWEWEGQPLPREHGGPVRFLVPARYFWKSAKWVTGIRLLDHDEPGFWEVNGYHNRGDPWKEERYWGD
jgi:DMSO/TMAO reductase YedYZ molybdopterin-dependent catalytic subunit